MIGNGTDWTDGRTGGTGLDCSLLRAGLGRAGGGPDCSGRAGLGAGGRRAGLLRTAGGGIGRVGAAAAGPEMQVPAVVSGRSARGAIVFGQVESAPVARPARPPAQRPALGRRAPAAPAPAPSPPRAARPPSAPVMGGTSCQECHRDGRPLSGVMCRDCRLITEDPVGGLPRSAEVCRGLSRSVRTCGLESGCDEGREEIHSSRGRSGGGSCTESGEVCQGLQDSVSVRNPQQLVLAVVAAAAVAEAVLVLLVGGGNCGSEDKRPFAPAFLTHVGSLVRRQAVVTAGSCLPLDLSPSPANHFSTAPTIILLPLTSPTSHSGTTPLPPPRLAPVLLLLR